jgi:hypothetical protein
MIAYLRMKKIQFDKETYPKKFQKNSLFKIRSCDLSNTDAPFANANVLASCLNNHFLEKSVI